MPNLTLSIAGLLLLTASLGGAAMAQQAKGQEGAASPAVATAAESAWQNAVGQVVKADPSTNTLVLELRGKETTFSLPGRISMLNLESGDKVAITYFPQGKGLRIWALKRLNGQ